ncbi:MAG TPA: HAMP domain-containing sensor histidine kinase [Melioribacteraceae bacterium]|nr:HAMP domain-containing sensor histidine kinase [Melioribacteraceae bacterium]
MRNYLVKFILIVLTINSLVFAQTETYETIITEISKNGVNIDPEMLKNSSVTSKDILKIKFDVKGTNPNIIPLSYKITLNGAPVSIANISDKSVELKQLSEGYMMLRIQGIIAGKDVSPKNIEFTVKNEVIKTEETNNAKQPNNYVFYGIILVLIIIIVILLIKKKNTVSNIEKNSASTVDVKPNGTNGVEVAKAYEKLKLKYKELEEENSFQRSQIRELKDRITDLEHANLKLLEKKDKLVESKQQLEELQAQKEELFAIAIHDIKNPASAIKSYLELITSYDLNAVEQSEIMESMIRSSEQIVELAHEMTSVIAQTKPEPMLNLEFGSLKKIIDSVCTQNKGYALKKQINLLNKSSIDLPETKLDPAKIEEVLDNLVNNALKYSPANSTVVVNTFFTKEKITVEVTDTGVGLSEEDIKKAFQKGGRLTPKPTGNETSSGLGLWIVKKIIEEHGGRVWVKSKTGKGSTFSFELPIVK